MKEHAQHPVTLRFYSDTLEQAFLQDYTHRSLRQVRYGLLLGILLYGLVFGAVDVLNEVDRMLAIWSVRLVVCLVGLGVLGFSYTVAFRRAMQPVLGFALLMAGWGLFVMLALDTSGEDYYDGPVLVILPTYVLLRLRFIHATVVGWLITAAFVVVALFVKDTPMGAFVSSLIFFSSANLIGMFAGYQLERYARRDYLQALAIDEKRRENARLLDVRSRLFADLSHEFRTPLTLILGPLDTLLETEPDADPLPVARERLAMMRQSARRLLRLIGELLDLAKLEAGSLRLDVRPVRAATFLRGIVATFAGLAERQGIDLRFEAEGFGETDPALVPGQAAQGQALWLLLDRDKLDKVLVNLVSNAIKFTPRGGTVRVRAHYVAEEPDRRLVVEVKDTGRGIPADALPYVFERFRQARHSEAGGTGIGLALTKELVLLHGGDVRAASEEGFGSTFTVTLPAKTAPTDGPDRLTDGAEEAKESASSAAAFLPASEAVTHDFFLPITDKETGADEATEHDPRETVLVVEDDAGVRAYVCDCLGDAYRALEAGDGAEGLEIARREVPDLVLSDVMMPRLDGYGLCRALKSDAVTGHIPVVLLTAKASEESKIEGLETGADDYLAKPFSARELQVRVKNLLDTRRLLRRRFSRDVLLRPEPTSGPSETNGAPTADDLFIERAREAVEAHLDDVHFDVDAFAEAMGMSRRQLQRKLRAVADESPSAFVRIIRLRQAATLLKQQRYETVAEVAYAVGFSSPSYFTRCFRDAFDAAPTEYAG